MTSPRRVEKDGQRRTALICGISGQDGALLARRLIDRGYRVCGTSRDAAANTFENLGRLGIRERVVVESMIPSDFRSVLRTLAQFQPDEVYNLAGQSSVALSFEEPVETLESISVGTLHLLEGIRFLRSGTRFYNACSGECFGDTGDLAADEETPFHPKSPYAVAKATAFWEVVNYRESYGLFACSGIMFNHESAFRPERFVTQKIVRAACRIAAGSGERLQLGNLDIRRDWGWAPEYVEAMWLMLQRPEAMDFVIATGETQPLESFIAHTFSTVHLDWREHVDHNPALMRPSDLRIGRANPSLAKQQLGWKAEVRMFEVVVRMIEAERERLERIQP